MCYIIANYDIWSEPCDNSIWAIILHPDFSLLWILYVDIIMDIISAVVPGSPTMHTDANVWYVICFPRGNQPYFSCINHFYQTVIWIIIKLLHELL